MIGDVIATVGCNPPVNVAVKHGDVPKAFVAQIWIEWFPVVGIVKLAGLVQK